MNDDVVASYEEKRFGGRLGRYRFTREQAGVESIVAQLPDGLSFLDVPCGIGRWWPVLEPHASRIDALDISPAMLAVAEKKVGSASVPVTTGQGDAEALDLPDGSVDVVFSHALMKHLPIPLQYSVLSEFSRVSKRWVVCAFSVVEPLTYQIWKRRSFEDSFPLLPEQLDDMANSADLVVKDRKRCTTRLGVEYSVLLEKRQ
ncbi:MAG: class I SAM-dependent methyltransferase [Solirubrobacterales bacterium]|nr:class I SAM-dependent methyltransferase [Solirubrobacterales bacterium]